MELSITNSFAMNQKCFFLEMTAIKQNYQFYVAIDFYVSIHKYTNQPITGPDIKPDRKNDDNTSPSKYVFPPKYSDKYNQSVGKITAVNYT